MHKLIVLLFIVILNLAGYSQENSLKKIKHLPKALKEISGIEKFDDSPLIWGINDSGNDPIVYGFNTKGKIEKEVEIDNAENIDWEDLAIDHKGTLFISDSGNNYNDRKDLSIYIVRNFLLQGKEVHAKKINFSFEDQDEFPPEKDNMNFGAEALIYKEGFLYLFTKNRSKHLDGTVNVYKIPAKEGTYKAKKIGSYTCCYNEECDWITAATITKKGDEVLLLGKKHVWKLSNFPDDCFFKGDINVYALPGKETQKESICYKDKAHIYLADEKESKKKGRNLYEFSLK